MTNVAWCQKEISFLHAWAKGEHYDYTLLRARQDYTNDTLYSTTDFFYAISLTVTQAQEDEKEITLLYQSKSKDHKVIKKTPEAYALANALEYLTLKLYGFPSLKVVYSIDATGAFLELKNRTELKNYINSVINAVQHERSATPDFKGLLEQLRPSLLSDEYVVYSFLSEIHAYHLLYGSEWKMGKQQNTIEVPNPLTGEPLPGLLITEVKKTPGKTVKGKKEPAVYEVTMQQQVDQEKLSKAVNEIVADAYGKSKPEGGSTPPVDFSMSYKYTVKNDLILKATYIKKVVSAESKAIEEFILK